MASLNVAFVAWPNHPRRWRCFEQTCETWHTLLTAQKHQIRYVCSSESVRDPKHQWFGDELAALCKARCVRIRFRDGPPGLGENMNAALRMCEAEFIILVQDDRPLLKPLDVGPHIDYLTAHPDVAMIRYAWPQGRDIVTGRYRNKLMIQPGGFRRFDISAPWPYGDEPHLRHKSFMDRYGWYKENLRHGASEGEMLRRLRRASATILAADDIYCGHNCADVSAVINDTRAQGKHRNEWRPE